MSKWYDGTVGGCDVAVSNRVGLSRNLSDYPFPVRMKDSRLDEVKQLVKDIVLQGALPWRFSFIDMERIDDEEARSLYERQIIDLEFAENRHGEAVLLADDESIAILINGEDHVCIQALGAGAELGRTLAAARRADELLGERLSFAYNEQLGYLTEFPGNLGTGMRASVTLHLPMLEAQNSIQALAGIISKMGMNIAAARGNYSVRGAGFYCLSNRVTLGITEEMTVENLSALENQTAAQERLLRQRVSEQTPPVLGDKIMRAFGTLKYARMLDREEFTVLASYVRLGVSLGQINGVEMKTLYSMMDRAGSATISAAAGKRLSADEIAVLRADMARAALSD